MNNNFNFICKKNLKDFDSIAYLYEHKKTKAKIFHMQNDDKENAFNFMFKTIPYNSNGIAHIMEHSVLVASKKYNVQDLFFAAIKNSMATFINAMTYPERTFYLCSSPNHKDIVNLFEIYLEALFNNIIEEKEVFLQEGIRLYFDESGILKPNGIVFNEMKASYSVLADLEALTINKALYDNFYKYDSGGDPLEILSLTYQEFLNFYKKYYHPSNAYVFLYGDLELEKYLSLLDEYFSKYEYNDEAYNIEYETLKKRKRKAFATATFQGEEKENTSVSSSWIIAYNQGLDKELELRFLTELLIADSSPLKKALIESKLGDDLSLNSGLEINKDIRISIGLKGVKKEDQNKVISLIDNELERISKEGFEKKLLDSTVKAFEFSIKESSLARPRGIKLSQKISRGWMFRNDPFEFFQIEQILKNIKMYLKNDTRYFEKLLEEVLIKNPHQADVVMIPDPNHSEKLQKKEDLFIKKIESTLSEKEKEEIIKANQKLNDFQNRDDKDDLKKLPKLEKSDLDKLEDYKFQEINIDGIKGIKSILNTNGIVYSKFAFEVSEVLSLEEMYYIPLLADFLFRLGTSKTKYVDLSNKIKSLGSLNASFLNIVDKEKVNKQYFVIHGKSLKESNKELLEIIKEVLSFLDIENTSRLDALLSEYISDLEFSLSNEAFRPALIKSNRQFSKSAIIDDLTKGIDHYFFLKKESKNLPQLKTVLKNISKNIFSKSNLTFGVSCQEDAYSKVEDEFREFFSSFNLFKLENKSLDLKPARIKVLETYDINSQVAYNSLAFPSLDIKDENYPIESFFLSFMQMDYLFPEIRVKNGAYSVFVFSNGFTKISNIVSYRDPNIEKTYSIYENAFKHYAKNLISQENIDKSILFYLSKFNAPKSPASEFASYFDIYLTRITHEDNQKIYDRILNTKPNDFKEISKRLEEVYQSNHSRVTFAGKIMINKEFENSTTDYTFKKVFE